ncbi:MAG: anti-sigma F factor [Clostridiales bacterium]|nr:anti-sigma F factor [Clostridiales bacterium]
MMKNRAEIKFSAVPENESFARLAAAAFVMNRNSDLDFIDDIKTVVSEAVTNSIVHGYEEESGIIEMKLSSDETRVLIEITDFGKGIEDITLARTPLYSSKPSENRAGIGFTVMETFMDELEVKSEKGKYTKVIMSKNFR